MDKLRRLDRLQRLVEAAGGTVEGRKKLHKLVYLCQRSGTDLGQAFQFHMYGVYSPSLARDVDAATAWGLLEEKSSAGGAYEIRLLSEPRSAKIDPPVADIGLDTVRTLANESSATLEVLSTIVYLWDLDLRGEDLRISLRDVKGHLESLFNSAFDLAAQRFGIELNDALEAFLKPPLDAWRGCRTALSSSVFRRARRPRS